ncbi:ComEC/Rec2-related protein [Longilinea arvoryzae]|uniref:ComEC/Rec2-related protein n=1 Tax=Longilinea arvoryzae TaxID=360412 RepID=A0A0S7B7D9_9CHLR|nr:ComEC/Rec2 family competence protein [Longilinea arvoryzae]GAP13095.1 ComEC/Rec2-related protein [Longilinea arvoryzae]
MPLLWLSLAFLAGLALADGLSALPTLLWAGGAAAGVLLSLLEMRYVRIPALLRWRRFARIPMALLLVALSLGGLRGTLARPSFGPQNLAYYNDHGALTLRASVAGAPERTASGTRLRLSVTAQVAADGSLAPLHGLALVTLPADGNWRYGDCLEIQARPVTPPEGGSFSYREYLARQGVHSQLAAPQAKRTGRGCGSALIAGIYDLAERSATVLRQLYPQPEAALLDGILLGDDSDLPESAQQAFRDTGTAHIVAISGFNIAILAGLFVALLGRLLPRVSATVAAILLIAAYTVLVGGSPPVVRAAIMGAVGMFGGLIGRRQAGANSLTFTAALMCLFDPWLPWDPSFQLSFMATLGLVLYAGPLQSGLTGWLERSLPASKARRIAAPLAEYVLFTLAAQITTLPVIAYHFGRLSLSALIANPLVLPAQPALMILGGLSLLGGLLWLPLGQLLAWLAWPLAAYTLRLTALLSSLPAGAISIGQITPAAALLFYALLFAVTLLPRLPAGHALRRLLHPAASIAAVGLLAITAWQATLPLPDGRLHVEFFNGSSALITTPAGRSVLLAGQPSPALEEALPSMRCLDALVLFTPPDRDLADLLERCPPAQLYWAAAPEASALDRLQILQESLAAGEALQLDDDLTLRSLGSTAQGAALALEWRGLAIAWPNGLPPDQSPSVQVLVLGQADRTFEAWQAQWIIADGDGPAHWTKLNEWIRLATDGQKMWIEGK